MTTLQFHSEYEIVKWLASRDNFDRGLAELRESLADGTIVNGRGLVQKWLAVYDDVTTGRVVGSAPPVAQPAPVVVAGAAAAELSPATGSIDARTLEALEAERTLLQRMLQEARLWAEAAQEAAARADASSELIQAQASQARDDDRDRARRGGGAGIGLAVLALILIALMAVLLWPQLETRARALWTLLSSLAH